VDIEIGNYTDIFGLTKTSKTFNFLNDGKNYDLKWKDNYDWRDYEFEEELFCFKKQFKMQVPLRVKPYTFRQERHLLTVHGTEKFLRELVNAVVDVNTLIDYYTANDAEMLESWRFIDSNAVALLEDLFPDPIIYDELLPFILQLSILKQNESIKSSKRSYRRKKYIRIKVKSESLY
jgi:hypothetical protein